METRELFDLLEKLYSSNVIGLSKLARTLGISYNKLYVFINTLKKTGFNIVPCMNMRFLGLGLVMVISNDKISESECKPLFPKDYFTILMVPLNIEFKEIRSITGLSTSIHKIYLVEEAQLPKPHFIRYNVNYFDTLKKEKIWGKLLEIIEKTSREKEAVYKNVTIPQRITGYRIDKIDLRIMRGIISNPFISYKKLAEKLGVSVGKLRRRISSRIEPLMKGYRIMWAPYYKLFSAIIFTVIKTETIPSKILYEFLSEFPLTVLTTHNPSEEMIINAWLMDSNVYKVFREYMKTMEREYGIEFIESWGYLYSGNEKQIIPCKALVRYDKTTRKLTLVSLNERKTVNNHVLIR